MSDDDALAVAADPSFGQHFLVSPTKLSLLVEAAGIRPTDHVVELGAGAGTVARSLPDCERLTVVELDDRLIGRLRRNVPCAVVIQGDALRVIHEISCDVLIGNLPNAVTESLIDVLPELPFRTAVLAVGETSDLERLRPGLEWSEVTTISGDDLVPPQRGTSRIVRIVPAHREARSG
jgi:16S rRNA A1518/A1519 N6-dimethyltransferase RsmA/KsgA/DIM1 with predicted DNA glycosylase/AP lyase activity